MMRTLIPVLLLGCCGTTLPQAVAEAPDSVTHIVLTLDVQGRTDETGGRVIGQCQRYVDGSRVLTVHLGEINELEGAAMNSNWVSAALDHELQHAWKTCTDKDHE